MLPPGDIRNCLLALADIEPTMEKLFTYRFDDGILRGQSFGNLFLAAMNGVYGDFEEAVRHANEVLAVVGKVLPVTNQDMNWLVIMTKKMAGRMKSEHSYYLPLHRKKNLILEDGEK